MGKLPDPFFFMRQLSDAKLTRFEKLQLAYVKAIEAERDEAREENQRLREDIREAYEVYAGSDGLIPQTAPEAYQQQLLNQMAEILGKALPHKWKVATALSRGREDQAQ